MSGGLLHEEWLLQLASGPNGAIRLHHLVSVHSSGRPRHTSTGVLVLHGDFSSFTSNFAPRLADPDAKARGLAVWLARRGVDVWGFDRRWALTPASGDLSDYAGLSFEQEVGDVGQALSAARALRRGRGERDRALHLIGFSRGGFLAYAAAAADAVLPAEERQVAGLVPLDIWAALSPDDVAVRRVTCESAALERQYLAGGLVDSDNGFFIQLGELARHQPDEPSALLPGQSNRGALLSTVAQTYLLFAPTERYHLAAGVLDGGVALGLRESPERVIAEWLAQAAPHQSLREQADTDAIWCGDGSGPPAPDLARIDVPLLYIGAAGGYGDHGLYSTRLVGSSDVTALVIRRLPPEQVEADFGHADLLFARDAAELAWRPLLGWLASHD